MNNRCELPFYFEIPDLIMPPFDVTQYFVEEEQRTIARSDVKTSDRLIGDARSNTANWYQSFIKVEENSSQDKRDFQVRQVRGSHSGRQQAGHCYLILHLLERTKLVQRRLERDRCGAGPKCGQQSVQH